MADHLSRAVTEETELAGGTLFVRTRQRPNRTSSSEQRLPVSHYVSARNEGSWHRSRTLKLLKTPDMRITRSSSPQRVTSRTPLAANATASRQMSSGTRSCTKGTSPHRFSQAATSRPSKSWPMRCQPSGIPRPVCVPGFVDQAIAWAMRCPISSIPGLIDHLALNF